MGFLDETGLARFLSNLKAWINSYGNAASATKLASARMLKTSLASSADATFDGSANQENIPVSGILPVANGGTGSSTKNFVDLSSSQTIGGVKTFTSNFNAQGMILEKTSTIDGETKTHKISYGMNGDNLSAGIYDYTNESWVVLSTIDGIRTFYGNASTATKATQDASGNVITSTYATKAEVNAKSDDSNVVHATGNETVGGVKTFSSSPYISRINPYLTIKETDVDRTTNSAGYSGIVFSDKNGLDTGNFVCIAETVSGQSIPNHLVRFTVFGHGSTNTQRILVLCQENATNPPVYSFQPRGGTNDILLGNAGNRWKQLYAATSSIDTSDERKKSEIHAIPEEVLDAWSDVEWYAFKMNDAVKEKGIDRARIHSGLIAQRIVSVFKKHSLDAFKYSFMCHDSWEEKPAAYSKEGALLTPTEKAGDEYSLRYVEALCIEAAYQRRRADRLEARIAALEEKLRG